LTLVLSNIDALKMRKKQIQTSIIQSTTLTNLELDNDLKQSNT